MIYKDPDILITHDHLRITAFESEAIPISSIDLVSVKREVIGNYKQGAYLFFILGVLSVWFLIGFVFIALGIAAYNTNIYRHVLLIHRNGELYRALDDNKPARVQHVKSVLNALLLSNKIKSHTFVGS